MKPSTRKVECYCLVDKNLLAENVLGHMQESFVKKICGPARLDFIVR